MHELIFLFSGVSFWWGEGGVDLRVEVYFDTSMRNPGISVNQSPPPAHQIWPDLSTAQVFWAHILRYPPSVLSFSWYCGGGGKICLYHSRFSLLL